MQTSKCSRAVACRATQKMLQQLRPRCTPFASPPQPRRLRAAVPLCAVPDDHHQQASSTGSQWRTIAATVTAAATLGCSLALVLSPLQSVAQPLEAAEACTAPQPMAELAGLFTGEDEEERDPIDAFMLYGTTFKRFVIEVLDGEKIVSRRKGFTVETCVGSALAAQKMPSFQFLPQRDKAGAAGDAVCTRAEGAKLTPTCYESCEKACRQGLEMWATSNEARTGFQLLAKDSARMVQSCTRECTIDCQKPGKAYDFSIPYRK